MFSFKKIASALCLLVLTSSAFALTPAAHLQALLSPIKTLAANFKQTTTSRTAEFVVTAEGSVKIHRPGQFYWRVDKPGKQIIVINNGKLLLYDVDLQQVTVKKITAQTITLNPASLLSGDLKRLLKSNSVTEKIAGGVDIIRLTPLKPGGSIRWIDVLFSGNALHGLKFENQLNQITSIRFTNLRINKPILPSIFTLKLPKGVDVIGAD